MPRKPDRVVVMLGVVTGFQDVQVEAGGGGSPDQGSLENVGEGGNVRDCSVSVLDGDARSLQVEDEGVPALRAHHSFVVVVSVHVEGVTVGGQVNGFYMAESVVACWGLGLLEDQQA